MDELWVVTAEYNWRACEHQEYTMVVKAKTKEEAIDKARQHVRPKAYQSSFQYCAWPLEEEFRNDVAELHYEYQER